MTQKQVENQVPPPIRHNLFLKAVVLFFPASSVSAWLIVGVTVERLGAVSLPHRAKVLFTRRRSYISIACITAFFFIFYTRIIMTFGIVKIFLDEPVADIPVQIPGLNGSSTVYPTEETLINKDKEETILNICSPSKHWYMFSPGTWVWFDLVWYSYAPFFIILFCNIAIIIIVTRASSARKHMAGQGKNIYVYIR